MNPLGGPRAYWIVRGAQRVRSELQAIPEEQRQVLELAFYGGPDAAGDRRTNRHPPGDGEDPYAPRHEQAAQGVARRDSGAVVSEPHEPSGTNEQTSSEDRAILAALALLEAEDPELVSTACCARATGRPRRRTPRCAGSTSRRWASRPRCAGGAGGPDRRGQGPLMAAIEAPRPPCRSLRARARWCRSRVPARRESQRPPCPRRRSWLAAAWRRSSPSALHRACRLVLLPAPPDPSRRWPT